MANKAKHSRPMQKNPHWAGLRFAWPVLAVLALFKWRCKLKKFNTTLLVFTLFISFTGVAKAEKGPDILKIFDMFVITSAAASSCEKPDDETLTNFLSNLQMVTIRASMELESRYPDRTKEQITEAMKKKTEYLTGKVKKRIEVEGCESENVQGLIKRFHFHAKWNPYKK